jgi:hypothetical protein
MFVKNQQTIQYQSTSFNFKTNIRFKILSKLKDQQILEK